jgi:proteasome lid subunit RPN8/RPN11
MMIADYIKKQIRTHAQENSEQECCGFVFEKEALQCYNRSENPSAHFSISPRDYLQASRKGEIRGVYHSHIGNNKEFSMEDKQMSHGHNVPYFLYHLPTDNFLCYDPKKEKVVDIDKKFELGKRDCYTLVKDYYKDLGVEVSGNNDLGTDWLERNPDLIENLFDLNKMDTETLEALKDKDDDLTGLPISRIEWCDCPSCGLKLLKKHDVLVFELIKGAGPCHVGVYIGEGMMYHHPRKRFPTTEKLSGLIRKKIFKIYRYNNLNEQS